MATETARMAGLLLEITVATDHFCPFSALVSLLSSLFSLLSSVFCPGDQPFPTPYRHPASSHSSFCSPPSSLAAAASSLLMVDSCCCATTRRVPPTLLLLLPMLLYFLRPPPRHTNTQKSLPMAVRCKKGWVPLWRRPDGTSGGLCASLLSLLSSLFSLCPPSAPT